jgi:prevent-host-death family protein
MRRAALSEVKDDLSRYLRLAEKEEVLITRHGRPAGILVGFETEDDWFDYRLENDARFLQRVAAARESVRAGRVVKLEDLDEASGAGKRGGAGKRRLRPPPLRGGHGRR